MHLRHLCLRRFFIKISLLETEINRQKDDTLKGCSKRWTPGCVILDEKVASCLTSAGRKTQFDHLIFSQSGANLLEHTSANPHCIPSTTRRAHLNSGLKLNTSYQLYVFPQQTEQTTRRRRTEKRKASRITRPRPCRETW